jgi:hypothetical protein
MCRSEEALRAALVRAGWSSADTKEERIRHGASQTRREVHRAHAEVRDDEDGCGSDEGAGEHVARVVEDDDARERDQRRGGEERGSTTLLNANTAMAIANAAAA